MTTYFDTSFGRNDVIRRANHGKAWTEFDYAELKTLYKQGYSLSSMCTALERSATGIIIKLCHLKLIAFNNKTMEYEVLVAPDINFFTPQPQEPIMTTKTIETKTFITGVDAANQSDAQIFDIIANIEKSIEKLQNIKNKPKKLIAVIEQKQKDIDDLVAFVDARP